MSVNLVLEDESTPVIWRGPIIAGTVKQFWTDVIWSDVDLMNVDKPPGTGDVPQTVFQTQPEDGIVVVASPQELVAMIVEKAVRMASMMNVPILGLVENMSGVVCPHCGETFSVFGASKVAQTAADHGLPVLLSLPIDPKIAALCDEGRIEDYESDAVAAACERLVAALPGQ